MSDTLSKLFSALNAVVLERQADGSFSRLTEAPSWFLHLMPAAGGEGVVFSVRGVSAFVDHFLDEAEIFWAQEPAGVIRSGPWIESVEPGVELAFEARAVHLEGKPILVVELLGDSYWHHVEVLQRARESLLKIEELERKEATLERQVRQSQKLEALGTLAGGIAHDFNNVLFPIMLAAEMAQKDMPEGSRGERLLQQIITATDRAKDLVRQILTFGRQTEQERRVVRLTPILKETLKLMRSTLPTSIELRERLETEEDRVLADPVQIHQVLVNLFTNAGQALSDGPGTIEVELGEASPQELPASAPEQERPHLVMSVRDTGCGMAPEVKERVFEPFFTTKPAGTGLGLSVVHGIVRSCGGTVEVDTAPGHGTTMRVFLPLETTQPSAAPHLDEILRSGTERILVVDDEPGGAQMVRELLEGQGYRVVTALRPLQALRLIRADRAGFDLLITDHFMPEMVGVELARKALEIQPGLPVILCTGTGDRTAVGAGDTAGICRVLLKPVKAAELTAAVRAALEGRCIGSTAIVQDLGSRGQG